MYTRFNNIILKKICLEVASDIKNERTQREHDYVHALIKKKEEA